MSRQDAYLAPVSLDPDPVIDHYKAGIDQTLLRRNLRLTPQQRVEQLIEMHRLFDELHDAVRKQSKEAPGRIARIPHHNREVLDTDLTQTSYWAELEAFARRMTEARQHLPAPPPSGWYPFQTVQNLAFLAELLPGGWEQWQDLLRRGPVLDIGCGDGDMAFFAERYQPLVTAVDYAPANYNGMAGVRSLKGGLSSVIDIVERDVDAEGLPEGGPWGLVIVLGILYHLKNPLALLEQLSRRASWCVLSTKTASRFAGIPEPVEGIPAAYFLRAEELAQDATNFWIFTPAGLAALVERAGWEIYGWQILGASEGSPEGEGESGDQRTFAVLRSRHASDPAEGVAEAKGWHDLEGGCWRWSGGALQVVLENAVRNHAKALRLGFFLPETMALTPQIVQATVNGQPLAARPYPNPGSHIYEEPIPGEIAEAERLHCEIRFQNLKSRDQQDQRDLAAVITSVGLRPIWPSHSPSREP